MTRIRRRYGAFPLVAVALFSAATLALLGTGWRAIAMEALPGPSHPSWLDESAETRPESFVATADLDALLDANPFHPERRRPAVRFTPPSDEPSDESAPAPGLITLAGTILYPDGGGAAIVKQGQQPSQIVRRGAQFGTLTLKEVERGKATFAAADGSPVVLVSAEEGGS